MMDAAKTLRIGLCGLGMIVDETYAPLLHQLAVQPLFRKEFGPVEVALRAVVSRTGRRYRSEFAPAVNYCGPDALSEMLAANEIDAICVATPDDRHFAIAKAALEAGKHVLLEKPSVLRLDQWQELVALADRQRVLAKVVYHKLLDPDHKRLRTLVADGSLQHVNNGFCSLLEPKSISRDQFSEWISGRNPASYVAVHYLKLIDFTFGPHWRLARVQATGQRGQVADSKSSTWDAVQLRVTYEYPDGREAVFDIHTDWVTPENFPGAVEQEVQFRFDNGVWNAHQRKRGVECVIEGAPADRVKITPNHHYNGRFLEPWNQPAQRGYGLEAIQRFFEEVAFVEFGGPPSARNERLRTMQALQYNDLADDAPVVAVVQSCESILAEHAAGRPGGIVQVRDDKLLLYLPGHAEPRCLANFQTPA